MRMRIMIFRGREGCVGGDLELRKVWEGKGKGEVDERYIYPALRVHFWRWVCFGGVDACERRDKVRQRGCVRMEKHTVHVPLWPQTTTRIHMSIAEQQIATFSPVRHSPLVKTRAPSHSTPTRERCVVPTRLTRYEKLVFVRTSSAINRPSSILNPARTCMLSLRLHGKYRKAFAPRTTPSPTPHFDTPLHRRKTTPSKAQVELRPSSACKAHAVLAPCPDVPACRILVPNPAQPAHDTPVTYPPHPPAHRPLAHPHLVTRSPACHVCIYVCNPSCPSAMSLLPETA